MKTAVILAALCFAYVAAHHQPCSLLREMFGGYRKCVQTMNPDEETRKHIHRREGLDDEKTNCLRACILKEAGLMENAAFNFPRLTELLETCGREDSDMKDEMVEQLKSCQEDAEASDNECTVAGKYAKCAMEMMPSRGEHHRDDEPE